MSERDLALVLSGGGMNGLLLELGFLQRLREDRLWAGRMDLRDSTRASGPGSSGRSRRSARSSPSGES